jgi:hypothetical protein
MGLIRDNVYAWLLLLVIAVPLTYFFPLPGIALTFSAFLLFVLGWIGKIKAKR